MSITIEEVKGAVADQAAEIKTLVADLQKATDDLDGRIDKIDKDIDSNSNALTESKDAFQLQVEKFAKAEEALDAAVLKMDKLPNTAEDAKSLGQMAVESDELKGYEGGSKVIARMEGSLHSKAITSVDGSGGELIQPDRRGFLTMPDQPTQIRDLLMVNQTNSNAIEYIRENVFTNNAETVVEGALKPESDITFTNETESVKVIAHWIHASRQVLSDAPALRSYIDGRLRFGLAAEEEQQLLLGDGVSSNLNGLVPNATAGVAGVSGDTTVDVIRRRILQVTKEFYSPNGIIMSPDDWAAIELLKTTDGAYLFSNPGGDQSQKRLWGRRVVEGNSMTAGNALIGAFNMAATLWDREQVTVRLSEHDQDDFVKNMVKILCEERISLTIEHPKAIVYGSIAAVA